MNYFLPGGRRADRDDSDTGGAAVVRPVVVERCGVGEDAGLVVVDVVAEVVVRHLLVLALIVHPALRQICKTTTQVYKQRHFNPCRWIYELLKYSIKCCPTILTCYVMDRMFLFLYIFFYNTNFSMFL